MPSQGSKASGVRPGQPRVAIVVPRPPLARLIALVLNHGAYERRIVPSVAEAKDLVASWQPHLAVVDLDSGEGDPLDLVALARPGGERLPVIGTTGKRDVRRKLQAYERGIEDMLAWPFAPEDLIAGALALMKRVYDRRVEFIPTVRIGQLELDLVDQEPRWRDRRLNLTTLERAFFYLFAANPGTLMSREELLDLVWGADFAPESNVVDHHVAQLRSKFGEWGPLIETVYRGGGYRLEAERLGLPRVRPEGA